MRLLWALGGAVVALVCVVGAAWFLVPPEPVDRRLTFDASRLGPDLDAYLAQEEARYPDITPGVQKRIVWAGAAGQKTAVAVVYLHGFSATSEEIRPVPDEVARALGANLFFTRFTGHGETGAALAQATAGDWINDTAEALAIGRRLGDKVIVIGTSTGGTLAAIAATDPRLAPLMDGVVFISPNFGLHDPRAFLLNWPLVRIWGPWVAGRTLGFTPENPLHAKYWTTRYPMVATVPLAALVGYAARQAYSNAHMPALFVFSPKDQVVRPDITARVAQDWGAPVKVINPVLGPKDDPSSHVIAGAILSPDQTAPTVAAILDWARGVISSR